jgi:lysozyme family protein
VWAAGSKVVGTDLCKRMGVVMRIRRNVLAPAILAVGTIGSLVAGPVLALTTAAAPATTAVAVVAHPAVITYHG